MFKNHPKGMVFLFFTEMWERFGFYILMAVLVLYMDKELGWTDSQKGDYYGWFLGAVYFIPLLGGLIGDRFLGQIRTVQLGAVIMAAAYVALALSSVNRIFLFNIGLIFVALGTGIFKVNISVLIGSLYRERPELKDAGFNIYYMGVNLGAAIAPLVATGISILFHSYRISFWAAAIGMLLSLAVFQWGKPFFRGVDMRSAELGTLKEGNPRPASGNEEGQRILTLIILFIIVSIFWVAFYQNGFALTLFAERSTVKSNILRPETYQFFDPFFILLLTPPLLSLFDRLRSTGREPSTPRKIFLGMFIMGAAMLVMVLASIRGGNLDQNIMSPMWLIGTYFLVTLAEILISPMGQSYVSKVSPPRFQGVMMGGWFVAISLGSYGSGLIGKYYSNFAHHQYFLLLTALLGLAAVLVFLFMKKLEKFSD